MPRLLRAIGDEFNQRFSRKDTVPVNKLVGLHADGAVVLRDRNSTLKAEIPNISEKSEARAYSISFGSSKTILVGPLISFRFSPNTTKGCKPDAMNSSIISCRSGEPRHCCGGKSSVGLSETASQETVRPGALMTTLGVLLFWQSVCDVFGALQARCRGVRNVERGKPSSAIGTSRVRSSQALRFSGSTVGSALV